MNLWTFELEPEIVSSFYKEAKYFFKKSNTKKEKLVMTKNKITLRINFQKKNLYS